MPEEYTADQLAQATGVPAGTLRVWESRYGFPSANRTTGNRKRYGRDHVEQIGAVLAYRRRGLSLPAAIERARGGGRQAPRSLFAALRSARPDLSVRVMPKRELIALSRAIEDEAAARATGGVLVGSFQRERHYRASERRWERLAATVDTSVVFADFTRLREDPHAPIEIPLGTAHPLEREWTVVLHSAHACACLSAWEVPAPRVVPDGERSFELLWSCDPAATRAALDAAGAILDDLAPDLPPRILAGLRAAGPVQPDMDFSDALTSRAFAYLAAVDDAPASRRVSR